VTEKRLRQGDVSRLAALIGLLCLLAQPGNAQQRFLRDGVALSDLRFIGVEADGVEITSLLTADDAALLVATDEVRTLNYLIGGRLPVQASRLQQLIDWGLMRQEGDGFRSLIPVIRGDRAQRFYELIEEAAPAIAAESQLAMDRLSGRLWRHPGVAALPAVTAWMMRDRVWAHLAGPDGLGFERRLEAQQAASPERGFWGALWYTEDPAPPAFDLHEWRREEYTIQIAWNYGSGDPLFGATDGPVPLDQLLAKLRSGGRRLGDREDFPGVLAAGLVDPEGGMRVMASQYRLDGEDSLAYVVEETAVAITEAILRHLPAGTLAPLLGVARETAAVIAYTELAPRLVTLFHEQGLLVRAGDPRADWRAATDSDDEESGSPRRAAVVGDEARAAGVGEGVPPYSAMIWRDLPARSRLRIAWW